MTEGLRYGIAVRLLCERVLRTKINGAFMTSIKEVARAEMADGTSRYVNLMTKKEVGAPGRSTKFVEPEPVYDPEAETTPVESVTEDEPAKPKRTRKSKK